MTSLNNDTILNPDIECASRKRIREIQLAKLQRQVKHAYTNVAWYRERMDEIPRDVPVYLHCRSSQRSYYAICCLQGNGYDNVVNISGSYLGISLYEYFDDKRLGREPIMDAYNFR